MRKMKLLVKILFGLIFMEYGLCLFAQDSTKHYTVDEQRSKSIKKYSLGINLTPTVSSFLGNREFSYGGGIVGAYSFGQTKRLSIETGILYSGRNLVKNGSDPWEQQDVATMIKYNYTLTHQVLELPLFLKFKINKKKKEQKIKPFVALCIAPSLLIGGKLKYTENTFHPDTLGNPPIVIYTVDGTKTTSITYTSTGKQTDEFTPKYNLAFTIGLGGEFLWLKKSAYFFLQYQFDIREIGPEISYSDANTGDNRWRGYKAITMKFSFFIF